MPKSPGASDDALTVPRILEAAVQQIASVGAADLALSGVARAAGVSKALIHYHFRDKDTLLARIVDHLTDGLVRREQDCLSQYRAEHNPLAVDALWGWLASELRRGDIRVLLELDAYRGEQVKAAARRAAARRRATAHDTIALLFRILDLRPRIESSLLADVVVAFVDGLAQHVAAESDADSLSAEVASARVSFDVFWLAMLSLAE